MARADGKMALSRPRHHRAPDAGNPGDFERGHMHTDVNHFLAEAEALGYVPAVASSAFEAHAEAERQGLAEKDFSAA